LTAPHETQLPKPVGMNNYDKYAADDVAESYGENPGGQISHGYQEHVGKKRQKNFRLGYRSRQ
jgi:hypothetical protein